MIFIMLDAARPDRFSSYGYERRTTPGMDRIAAKGVLFRNHYTQGTHTRVALPALLYSRYFIRPLFPNSNAVPFSDPDDLFRVPDAESVSLPRALREAGFRTAMISAHLWLKPNTIFASEFDESYDLSTLVEYDRMYRQPRARYVVDFAIDWLERNGDRDFFLYLHFMDTHFPHHFEEDASRFLGSEALRSVRLDRFRAGGRPIDLDRALEAPEQAYLNALYDGSLRYADREIGRLLDWLGPRLDRTLITVTSDHGEFLMERPGRFGHGGPWLEGVARVPWILSYPPRLPAGAWEGITESIDVMPTLLGLLGVELPQGRRMDGEDLRPALRGEAPPRAYAFARRAVRGPGYKCLLSDPGNVALTDPGVRAEAVRGELFDLATDPAETTDVWARRPDLVERCLTRYRARLADPYRRYLDARTDHPPASPFAIASRHFTTRLEVPTAPGPAAVVRHLQAPGGWIQFNHEGRDYLIAHGDTPPLDLQFPMPDGRYGLSVGMRGSATLRVHGGPEIRLDTRPFSPTVPVPTATDHARYGVIDVREGRFAARLTPETDRSPLLVRYLGFRPLGPDSQPVSEEDAAREQRLRQQLKALGYID